MNSFPDFYIQFKFFKTVLCCFQNWRYQATVPISQKTDFKLFSYSELSDYQINFIFIEIVV